MALKQPFVTSQFWAVSRQDWGEKLKTTVLGGLHLGEISQCGLFTVSSNGVSFVHYISAFSLFSYKDNSFHWIWVPEWLYKQI